MSAYGLHLLGFAMFFIGLGAAALGLWNHSLIDVGSGAILMMLPVLFAMSGRRRVSEKTNNSEAEGQP